MINYSIIIICEKDPISIQFVQEDSFAIQFVQKIHLKYNLFTDIHLQYNWCTEIYLQYNVEYTPRLPFIVYVKYCLRNITCVMCFIANMNDTTLLFSKT